MSFDILQEKISRLRSPICVGLDPTDALIPQELLDAAISRHGFSEKALSAAYLQFCKAIIASTADIVPAVKIQSAYFERLGPAGVSAMKAIGDEAKAAGMYVICDAKRGDIGPTSAAYAEALLGSVKLGGVTTAPYSFDSATVNPYLGTDCLKPFLEVAVREDKTIFVLVKTSNPSSGELQDLELSGGELVYEKMGRLIEDFAAETAGAAGFTRAGAVIGATYPEVLAKMRRQMPKTFFLVPGVGAQGATASDVAAAFRGAGSGTASGAIINSSRGIIGAWKTAPGGDWKDAVRAAARELTEQLRAAVFI
ncbi:MAG: orotidine-5'-phosphate decarboxylase [Oscillospiraceae bacterium]|jgi:orotidine-5'-phosphate decarboxylase|nr:orotidine-5'-phosphate decarboxylase [Oscillospiraceae bacterium]